MNADRRERKTNSHLQSIQNHLKCMFSDSVRNPEEEIPGRTCKFQRERAEAGTVIPKIQPCAGFKRKTYNLGLNMKHWTVLLKLSLITAGLSNTRHVGQN